MVLREPTVNIPSALTLTINGVIADFGSESLRDEAGSSIDLRPQAFAVLRYMSENANRLVTKDELMQVVWPGVVVTDDSLVQCIHEIRRALDDEKHAVLKTVPKRGYRLNLATKAAPGPSASHSPGRVTRIAITPALIAGMVKS
jgi:DNA-binding winged helix-turn-helix (wHTH) protein